MDSGRSSCSRSSTPQPSRAPCPRPVVQIAVEREGHRPKAESRIGRRARTIDRPDTRPRDGLNDRGICELDLVGRRKIHRVELRVVVDQDRVCDRDLEADRVVVPGSDEGRKKSSVFRLQLLKGLGRQRRL